MSEEDKIDLQNAIIKRLEEDNARANRLLHMAQGLGIMARKPLDPDETGYARVAHMEREAKRMMWCNDWRTWEETQ